MCLFELCVLFSSMVLELSGVVLAVAAEAFDAPQELRHVLAWTWFASTLFCCTTRMRTAQHNVDRHQAASVSVWCLPAG